MKGIEPNRAYVGFEPNPRCFVYCDELVRINHLANVVLVPVGLSAASEVLRLHLYSKNDMDSAASTVENFRPSEPVVSTKFVPVFRFADIIAPLGITDISIIKIDIEGAEFDVLQSMEATLAADRPWIVIEILPCYSSNNSKRISRQESIEALLRRVDYRMLKIDKTSEDTLHQFDPIETIGVHGDLSRCDYVFCPTSDVDSVIASHRTLAR